MPDALLLLFAGMGFSFIGVRLLFGGVSGLSGPRMRNVLRRSTAQGWRTAVMGTFAGAVMQSNNAITFITAGLITAKAVSISRGLMLIGSANIGASILVFIAAFDIGNAVLVLVGLVGFAYGMNLDKKTNNKHLFTALLGLSLLLFGLLTLKSGAKEATQWPAVVATVAVIAAWPWLAFMLGMLITPLTQTAKTAAIIAVAAVSADLLPLDQAVMIVLGSNFASSINAIILGSGLSGTSRQASYFQALLKIAGTLPLLALFSLDHLPWDYRPGTDLLAFFFNDPGMQLALAYLLAQIAAMLVLWPFWSMTLRVLEHLAPASASEELAKPRYLSGGCCEDVATAVELARMEQRRQINLLAAYPDRLHPDADPRDSLIAPRERRAANAAVMAEIDTILRGAVAGDPRPELLQQALALQDGQTLLAALQDSLLQFIEGLEEAQRRGQDHPLAAALVESAHLILTAMPAALDSGNDDGTDNGVGTDSFEFAALMQMTGDKSAVMEAIRHSLLQNHRSLPVALHPVLFRASNQFERIVWLVRRIALLLMTGAHQAPGSPSPAEGP